MRLSEAILKGCKLYPHHSRYVIYDNANGTSTVGAAYAGLVDGRVEFVHNCQTDHQYRDFPVLGYWVWDPISHGDNLVESVIWIYETPNSRFLWSRERIAKWVARHERKWLKQGKPIDVFIPEKPRGPHPNRRWREDVSRET